MSLLPNFGVGLQYRTLKAFWPGEPTYMDGSAYVGVSKVHALLGDLLGELAGKHVIDFGCGTGEASAEMAKTASFVTGVDIRESVLEVARRTAPANCRFTMQPDEPADVIVSLDSFEHFADPAAILLRMAELLKPGGSVISSFGPTWYHPFGGHLFSVFPWAHLVFSEQALLRWRADLRADGARRFEDVEGGLNRMTIARFERLVEASPFRAEHLELAPIRGIGAVHNRLTREFWTALVRCKLTLQA